MYAAIAEVAAAALAPAFAEAELVVAATFDVDDAEAAATSGLLDPLLLLAAAASAY